MKSVFENLGGGVEMPAFKGRKLYMHKTLMNEVVLPEAFNGNINMRV